MSFPEEPLDLAPGEGGGYYPAAIHQELDKGNYKILRKLGFGPRSSTWLVALSQTDPPDYFAVTIYTVTASERAQSKELPILEVVDKLDWGLRLPVFHGSFWEKSDHGSHLCIVTNPLSTSARALQSSAENQRLSVHVVQRLVYTAAKAIEGLHQVNIMHGAVKVENILFCTDTLPRSLDPILESEPPPTIIKIKNYHAVQSQPLTHSFRWNAKPKKVVDWPLYFVNLGHAQQSIYKPEENTDYLSAPETLLAKATCSLQTDIWMLGVMAFTLLTGSSPFPSFKDVATYINAMHTILDDEVPAEWLSDSEMKEYDNSPANAVTSIEKSLKLFMHKDDAAEAAAYIKGCLRLDPNKRFTATQAYDHAWLSSANACSCRFC